MTNFIEKGATIPYTVPNGVTLTVGQAFMLGTLLVVVLSTNNNTATATAGDEVTCSVTGVYSLPKVAGTGFNFAKGDKVYWDAVQLKVTNDASASTTAPTATIAISTAAALNDTLASLKVGTVNLLSGALTLVADGTTLTEDQIATAINAGTATHGYTAVATTNLVTITGPVGAGTSGASINGVVITVGAIVGTMVLGTPSAFTGGVDAAAFVGYAWDTAVNADTTAAVKLWPAGVAGEPADTVAALTGTLTGTVDGVMENVADIACAGGSTPSATNVNTAVNAAILTINLEFKELFTKQNELIAKLKAAGIVS